MAESSRSRTDRRPKAVLTLGKFDGVHAGHRKLLTRTIEEAGRRETPSAALVLHPDPRSVIDGERVPLLTALRDRCARMRSFGVDYAEPLHFTRAVAALDPQEFMDRVAERFRLSAIVVGPDFAFGRDRAGDIEALESLGRIRGFDVLVVEPLMFDGRQIGSRHVRSMVEDGDVHQARSLLRAPPRLVGTVVHGSARGRTLGFPTANLDLTEDFVVPANGIYTVRARWHRHRSGSRGQADGLASIGVRPTFDAGPRVVEVFLLDFSGDLYGCQMTIDFLARQRPELRFASPGDLVAQMSDDVVMGRAILEAEASPAWETSVSGATAAISVRGRDLAALCENASHAVYELLGVERSGNLSRGCGALARADSDEALLNEWLSLANEPLGSAETRHSDSTVFQAGRGTLHALLKGGAENLSRPLLTAVRASGSIGRDNSGWLTALVECELMK